MDLGKKDNFKPFSPLCAFFASHSSRINCQQTRTFIAKCTREGKQTKETRIVLGRINFRVFSCSLIVRRQIIWMIPFFCSLDRSPDGFRGDYVEWDLTSASRNSRERCSVQMTWEDDFFVRCNLRRSGETCRGWLARQTRLTRHGWLEKVGANRLAENGDCFRLILVSKEWKWWEEVGRRLWEKWWEIDIQGWKIK